MKPPLGTAYVSVVKRNLEALGNIWIQLSLDPKHVVHSFRCPKTIVFWFLVSFRAPRKLEHASVFQDPILEWHLHKQAQLAVTR